MGKVLGFSFSQSTWETVLTEDYEVKRGHPLQGSCSRLVFPLLLLIEAQSKNNIVDYLHKCIVSSVCLSVEFRKNYEPDFH